MSEKKWIVARFVLSCVLLIVLRTTTLAYAENWLDLLGDETLWDFVAGATAKIELKEGVVATGEYYEYGTAEIEAWGETFPRTWETRGDDKVCCTPATVTNCYTFEQNLDVPGEYRSRHVETGKVILFRISGTDPRIITRDTVPDDEGGLVVPSAKDFLKQFTITR